MVLEKTLESPLDCKEIKTVNSKGDQPWIFIGRTDVEAETPILWPPDAKSWKGPDAGKDWGQEKKGTTEDEMVGWYHRLSGHEFEQTPRDGEGQGSQVCCSPWGPKASDASWWLSNSNKRNNYCHRVTCICPETLLHWRPFTGESHLLASLKLCFLSLVLCRFTWLF